jgi:hypothetical protein
MDIYFYTHSKDQQNHYSFNNLLPFLVDIKDLFRYYLKAKIRNQSVRQNKGYTVYFGLPEILMARVLVARKKITYKPSPDE